MTWDGFLPAHNCKRCGTPLSRDLRPAELYLGTYTGLCYKCQNAPMHVLATSPLDGCMLKEYSPGMCGSYQRDRLRFVAYKDCAECKGRGYNMVERSFASGGSYASYCLACRVRQSEHPRRAAHSMWYQCIYALLDKYELIFQQRLVDEYGFKGKYTGKGKARKLIRAIRPEGFDLKQVEAMNIEVLQQYQAERDRLTIEEYSLFFDVLSEFNYLRSW